MKKGATLFAVLWAVLGLGLLVGLPVAIHFILGQYDEAGFSGPQLVFEEQGHSYLAFTLDDYRANEVDNGVVHGSSRSYAQVVDLEDGSLRWSARLDADNERGDDWGSGELLGQSSRYLFFLRNELYVLDRRDAAPALAFDELERRTGGLPLKSAPWGKDAYRYDEGRGGLLMLAWTAASGSSTATAWLCAKLRKSMPRGISRATRRRRRVPGSLGRRRA